MKTAQDERLLLSHWKVEKPTGICISNFSNVLRCGIVQLCNLFSNQGNQSRFVPLAALGMRCKEWGVSFKQQAFKGQIASHRFSFGCISKCHWSADANVKIHLDCCNGSIIICAEAVKDSWPTSKGMIACGQSLLPISQYCYHVLCSITVVKDNR